MSSPKKPSRRRFLRNSLDAGMVALLASTFAGRSFANEQAKGGGSITQIKGQVFVNGKAASPTTVVPVNAEVRTGKRSMVAFTAGGDAHVLKANTAVQLNGSSGLTDQLRLLSGALLSAWGPRPEGRQAKLTSGTATIGIRGTVTFTTKGRFSLLQGAVQYTYKGSDGQERTVTLTRDETTNKPVSVDETGTKINWVPPITASEATVLKETIKAAVAEVKAAAAAATGKEAPTEAEIEQEIARDTELTAKLTALTQIETVVEDVEEATGSGEIDVKDFTPEDDNNDGGGFASGGGQQPPHQQ